MPVSRSLSTVTKEQAYEDLSELIYLINNRYCGKEYSENQGMLILSISQSPANSRQPFCLAHASHSAKSSLAYIVVDQKSEIEKIREQIQNIE